MATLACAPDRVKRTLPQCWEMIREIHTALDRVEADEGVRVDTRPHSTRRSPLHCRTSSRLESYADKGTRSLSRRPRFPGSRREPTLTLPASRPIMAVTGEQRMKAYDFKVLLEPDETGGYVVTCPSLPGCYSQGNTVDGALDNIREAIELCLEDMQAHGEAIPDPSRVLVGSIVVTR
jgi:antitoxin HicB